MLGTATAARDCNVSLRWTLAHEGLQSLPVAPLPRESSNGDLWHGDERGYEPVGCRIIPCPNQRRGCSGSRGVRLCRVNAVISTSFFVALENGHYGFYCPLLALVLYDAACARGL